MPDLKVRHPVGLFTGLDAKQNFMQEAAFEVSIALESLNYADERLVINPDDVDVQLMPYEPEDANIRCLVLFELAGYDFPDRMKNLSTRLLKLKAALSTRLWKFADHDMVDEAYRESRLCVVSFTPVSAQAWV